MNIYCQITFKIYVSKYCLTKQILTSGLLCHHWYRLLDNFLPGRTLKTIVFKIAWDQVALDCISNASLVGHMLFHLQPDRQGTWVCSDRSIKSESSKISCACVVSHILWSASCVCCVSLSFNNASYNYRCCGQWLLRSVGGARCIALSCVIPVVASILLRSILSQWLASATFWRWAEWKWKKWVSLFFDHLWRHMVTDRAPIGANKIWVDRAKL